MLNERITALINDQINMEWYSAYFYLSIHSYYVDQELNGFGNWFYVQTQEERDHAMLFVKYLQNNSEKIHLFDVKAPSISFDDFRSPIVAAFEHDMELYGLNGASYYLSVSSKSEENESEQKSLFKIAEEAKGNWAICNKEDKLQTIKLIKDLQTSRPIGYLRISLKRSYIDKMSNDISFGSNGRIIVLDSNSDAVCGKIDENLRQYFVKLAQNSGTMSYSEAGKTYTVIYYHSNKTEWETIGLIPNDYLSKDLKSFRSMMLIIAVILLGICVLITNLLAKQFISPIEDTAKALEKFSQGDFSVRLSEDRSDEIGRMNIVFNSTIQNVQKLMQKVTQAEILEREMEYKTLQSQMNPHFLYNTLDVINWMAWKKGEKEICRLITAVSNLMRISISNKQSIITLEQELSYVKDYLYIQHEIWLWKFSSNHNCYHLPCCRTSL